MKPFKQQELDNGLRLEFFDRTNRYFGDYHRICVEARISLSIPEHSDQGDALWARARQTYGALFTTTKQLERMAVPGAEVESVRERLIDDFLAHAAAYMSHPEYPSRLLAAELSKSKRIHPLFPKR